MHLVFYACLGMNNPYFLAADIYIPEAHLQINLSCCLPLAFTDFLSLPTHQPSLLLAGSLFIRHGLSESTNDGRLDQRFICWDDIIGISTSNSRRLFVVLTCFSAHIYGFHKLSAHETFSLLAGGLLFCLHLRIRHRLFRFECSRGNGATLLAHKFQG